MSPPDPTEPLLDHARFLRRLALRLVHDEGAADDVVQETWLAALAHPPRRPGPLRPWLARVARNAALKLGRRRARDRALAARLGEGADGLDPGPGELADALGRSVQALPQPQRRALFLRFTEDLPPREIARREGVPLETVKSRLKRALATLRARLDAEFPPDRRPWSAAGLALASLEPARAPIGVLGVAMNAKLAAGIGIPLALAGAALWLYSERAPGAAAPSSATSPPRGSVVVGVDAAAPGSARLAISDPAPPPIVRGRVTDPEGAPIEDALVYVGAREDPFDPEARVGSEAAWNDSRGRELRTDADGRFAARLAGTTPVEVRIGRAPHYEDPPYDADFEDVVPPAVCDFVVVPRATTELVIRALDLGSRRPLERFRVALRGATAGFRSRLVDRGELEELVPTGDGAQTVTVWLTEPEVDPRPEVLVRLAAGERRVVELALPASDRTVGRVLATDGRPLAGACVWFGRVGDDEPFEAFDPDTFVGVRTDAAGWFELPGHGDVVSAWHPEHTATTVARGDCARIELGPRGAIEGFALDAEGRPRAGLAITLDEARTTHTDAAGRFAFEAVESGPRGLQVEGEQPSYVRVDVEPERTTTVRLADRTRATLRVLRAGVPWREPIAAFLVPLGPVGSTREVAATGPDLELASIFPGRYLLWTAAGTIAPFTLDGERATVELGAADLTIVAAPGTRIALAPAGSDALVRLLARRLELDVPKDGRLVVAPLPVGDYELLRAGERQWRPIGVVGSGAEIELE